MHRSTERISRPGGSRTAAELLEICVTGRRGRSHDEFDREVACGVTGYIEGRRRNHVVTDGEMGKAA